MNKLLTTAAVALAATFAAGTANAAVLVYNASYASPPSGTALAIDSTRFSGGGFIDTGTGAGHAQPFSSVGRYWAVGPTDGTPGFLDVTGFSKISFLWGSVDDYNKIEFYDAADNLLGLINGIQVGPPANGDQSDAATNRYVTLNLLDSSISGVTKLKFIANKDAFETTNFLSAVPETSTWAMMILGLGGVGFAMRRSRQKVSVRYA
jgi:hypothetical protein